jgi:hypothetical protein
LTGVTVPVGAVAANAGFAVSASGVAAAA